MITELARQRARRGGGPPPGGRPRRARRPLPPFLCGNEQVGPRPDLAGNGYFHVFFLVFFFRAGGIRQPYGIINYPVRSSGRPYVKMSIFLDAGLQLGRTTV